MSLPTNLKALMPPSGCDGARIPKTETTVHLFVQAALNARQDSASVSRDLEGRIVIGPSALRTAARQKDEEFVTL